MINLCSDQHDEICHEGRTCHVCTIITEKDKTIEKLEDRISELEIENADLLDQTEGDAP